MRDLYIITPEKEQRKTAWKTVGEDRKWYKEESYPAQCEVTEAQPPTLQTGGLFSLVVWKKIYKCWGEIFLARRISNRCGEVNLALSIERGWKHKAKIVQRHTEGSINDKRENKITVTKIKTA